jgi:hypothetical protein
MKLRTKKYGSSQNDKNKIEDFQTSKYYNKKLSMFTRKKGKYPLSSLMKLNTTKLKTPK